MSQPDRVFPATRKGIDDWAASRRWRTGRKLGRTIYAIVASFPWDPSDDDVLIGIMDSPALAAEAVDAHNQSLED